LRKARTQVREQGATEYPKISADASAIRSNAALGPSTNGLDFYFLGFDASWELDFFGKVQSARAAAMAQADVSRSDLANVEVSLAAEIGRTYIELREHQAELQLLHRSADIEQRMLDLTQQRRARGVSSDLEVERFRTLVENTRAMTIPAEENIEASMDLLAVLTGSAPGSLDGELAEPKPLPDLPADVAIGDPAEMLRRRPDIRSAERQIAARAAILKVRTADLFPQVSLLGTLGYGSDSISGLFHNASFIYFAAPSLRWSFLDFGANRARVREASADVDEALALYRKAILEALQDAESSLSRYGHARRSVASLEQVKESADRAAELASQLQTAGALSVIDQLDTERTRLSAEEDLLRSKAALAEGFISLQKSLGLGWERGG
jgi:NodT family efflux transporter outer membrane factor (OMF) lipoprotein